MRLLYVEDDPGLRELACMILSMDDRIEVASTGDGANALRLLEQAMETAPFEALVIDAGMPPPDGPEVVRRLRADPRHDPMTILFLTGRSGDEARRELLASGADDVLVKPVKLDLLPDILAAAAARRLGELS